MTEKDSGSETNGLQTVLQCHHIWSEFLEASDGTEDNLIKEKCLQPLCNTYM